MKTRRKLMIRMLRLVRDDDDDHDDNDDKDEDCDDNYHRSILCIANASNVTFEMHIRTRKK